MNLHECSSSNYHFTCIPPQAEGGTAAVVVKQALAKRRRELSNRSDTYRRVVVARSVTSKNF